jgi:hypothetical protein
MKCTFEFISIFNFNSNSFGVLAFDVLHLKSTYFLFLTLRETYPQLEQAKQQPFIIVNCDAGCDQNLGIAVKQKIGEGDGFQEKLMGMPGFLHVQLYVTHHILWFFVHVFAH